MNMFVFIPGFRIRFFFQNPDPGVCTSNVEIFSNVYKKIILDTIKRHLFCFYTFVVGRPLFEFSPDPGL